MVLFVFILRTCIASNVTFYYVVFTAAKIIFLLTIIFYILSLWCIIVPSYWFSSSSFLFISICICLLVDCWVCGRLSLHVLRGRPILILLLRDLSFTILTCLVPFIFLRCLFNSIFPFSFHSFIPCTLHFLMISSCLIRFLCVFPVIIPSILISAVLNTLCVLALSGFVSNVYWIIALMVAL